MATAPTTAKAAKGSVDATLAKAAGVTPVQKVIYAMRRSVPGDR